MLQLTHPPRLFAGISLLMIMAMVFGTAWVQAPFFRQSIIEREATMVRDLVFALTVNQDITVKDLQNYRDAATRQRFDQSFQTLLRLPGTALIKVFNSDSVIVWSDEPALVGSSRIRHPEHLARAMSGEVQALFNPAAREPNSDDLVQPRSETIECYVPIYSHAPDKSASTVIGVLSLYRDPQDLNRTIQQGLYLLWAVIGGGGAVLFLALYKVFTLVYWRQKAAESKFSTLTHQHERIVQIEKMSAMGELVGEIAHQLNSPLVGVINLTQLAEREIDNPQRVSELLTQVRKAGTECRDIVQRILRINQISHADLALTDLDTLVHDTLILCRQSIDTGQLVQFTPSDVKLWLWVDAVLIRQALFNLIHNALLAAPKGSVSVQIATQERDHTEGVLLSVTDCGPGFSPDIAKKLFKPFFTTRAQGTGLGLSVAQHIAMKHGGAVLAENLPRGGAKFSIWLPVITIP
ncbi:MAG: HAMP domain-containing histidine kinase [Rhodoferax sp.]|nr:HAMP domain-containing histidine kinase [Rhodoferax sp.]MCF8208162.1 HAMP domain-containing histidine kinase [Rhodoferax sp.]